MSGHIFMTKFQAIGTRPQQMQVSLHRRGIEVGELLRSRMQTLVTGQIFEEQLRHEAANKFESEEPNS
jgi:hypothetical protein